MLDFQVCGKFIEFFFASFLWNLWKFPDLFCSFGYELMHSWTSESAVYRISLNSWSHFLPALSKFNRVQLIFKNVFIFQMLCLDDLWNYLFHFVNFSMFFRWVPYKTVILNEFILGYQKSFSFHCTRFCVYVVLVRKFKFHVC